MGYNVYSTRAALYLENNGYEILINKWLAFISMTLN
jgi:hypothetical protein